MMRSCVWDRVPIQRTIAAMLRRAVESGQHSHAYLFVGQPGTGTHDMARALACAALCDDHGCGSCAACARVLNGSHPDVRWFMPEGAAGYVVDQAREIIHDANLRAVAGRTKVFVIDEADRLDHASANALLKTIEEPPPGLLLILLARSYDAVLPTVASRCQIVRFAPIPEPVAVSVIVERTGATVEEARAALRASGDLVTRAESFVRSSSALAARRLILDTLKRLPSLDAHDVLMAARELLAAVKAPVEDLKEKMAAELAAQREYFGQKASLADLELRQRRQLTAREREALGLLFGVVAGWLRDCLLLSLGETTLVVDRDAQDAIEEFAAVMTPSAAVRALNAVETARRRVSYNVNPQLATEAMLFDIWEVLKCPR